MIVMVEERQERGGPFGRMVVGFGIASAGHPRLRLELAHSRKEVCTKRSAFPFVLGV